MKHHFKAGVLSWGLILGVAFQVELLTAVRAHEFQVEGLDNFTAFRGDTLVVSNRIHFRVSVKDCRWLIRTKSELENVDYVEAGTDGTNVYVLTSILEDSARRQAKGEPAGINVGTAYITPGVVPHMHDGPAIPVLWLAYASPCYLDGSPDKLPILEFTLPSPYEFGRLMNAQVRRNESPPFLPSEVAFYHDGQVPTWPDKMHAPWVIEPTMDHFLPPFANGFTNSLLHAESFTNFNGLMLPTIVEHMRFLPKATGKSSNDLDMVAYHSISLTNLSKQPILDRFTPEIKGAITTADYRLANDAKPVFGPIRYLFDREWLGLQDIHNLTNFETQVRENKREYSVLGKATHRKRPPLDQRWYWVC